MRINSSVNVNFNGFTRNSAKRLLESASNRQEAAHYSTLVADAYFNAQYYDIMGSGRTWNILRNDKAPAKINHHDYSNVMLYSTPEAALEDAVKFSSYIKDRTMTYAEMGNLSSNAIVEAFTEE